MSMWIFGKIGKLNGVVMLLVEIIGLDCTSGLLGAVLPSGNLSEC
jgi:hypothetical protein